MENIRKKQEEIRLVNKAIELEMQEVREGKIKTESWFKIKKKYKW